MSSGGAWIFFLLPHRPFAPVGEAKSFFLSPRWLVPRFPPAHSPPRGVNGSLNSQLGCFSPDRGVGERGCGAGLFTPVGERCGCSQWTGAWSGYGTNAAFLGASASERLCFRARSAHRRVQGERSERAHAPLAIGRAEQRSGARIRAGACLSVASLRPTPRAASSARQPLGPRPLARLSFAYFSLAKQRKVRPAAGQICAQKIPFLCLLSFDEEKESNSASRSKPALSTSLQE